MLNVADSNFNFLKSKIDIFTFILLFRATSLLLNHETLNWRNITVWQNGEKYFFENVLIFSPPSFFLLFISSVHPSTWAVFHHGVG